MKEELLQFIWRFQYFNQHELLSEAGEPVQVLSPGELNTHQGPDFLDAQIRIGPTLLAGAVELHLAASDWDRHAHSGDPHYRNVILHVVWKNDRPGAAGDIPMLVLQHRISGLLLGQYEKWMKSRSFIPCERQLQQVQDSVWTSWKHQLLLQRLQRRALFIKTCLEQNRQDWEETTWWLMTRNFGLPVNAGAFEAIGKSLPVRLLSRYRDEKPRLEALLLGQAGLLENDPSSAYAQLLQKEYRYLRTKHHLSPIQIPLLFLRMRPAHFPTIRLAQLAALMAAHPAWFAAIKEADSPRDLTPWLQAAADGYWKEHYTLDAKPAAPGRSKVLGERMKNSLLINTFIPLLYAYGCLRKMPAYRDKAIRWLHAAAAEENAILKNWMRLGVTNENAADSQALLELKTGYCSCRKCLDCAIGKALLHSS